jgi:uncharacterized lipoprotein YddW (UPF0748 family)
MRIAKLIGQHAGRYPRFTLHLWIVLLAASCVRTTTLPRQPAPSDTSAVRPTRASGLRYTAVRAPSNLPEPEREFRGVWIATVDNIDWPTSPGLPTIEQKQQLLALFDAAKRVHLNAIILQIRPSADALYESELEPWSRYLTGQTGRAPDPRYDPLAFAVAEAHARGLELHAWFNPFRASLTNQQVADPSHISRARPDLVVTYGTMKWLNPGLDEARQHSLRVIEDVVRRYDIDGVHLDDYFYPYIQQDANGRNIPFPDSDTYDAYRSSGGTKSLGDWRRDNINTFVRDMYTAVHRVKPWMQVGISPFGIWRPGYPEGVRGLDSYAEIYADARLWLRSGWVDYMAPQLYWRTDAQYQPYTALMKWWVDQNDMGREILFGNAPFNVTRPEWNEMEIIRQIELTRMQPGAQGNIHFSAKSFLRSPNRLADLMTSEVYQTDVLTPALPWLEPTLAAAPRVDIAPDTKERLITIDWSPARNAPRTPPRAWILRTRTRGAWSIQVLPPAANTKTISYGTLAPDLITVSSVGRNGVESAVSSFSISR